MTAHINVLRHLAERQRPSRLPYLRQYPPNTTWHGWLSPNAIATLELAGNTVPRPATEPFIISPFIRRSS